MTSTSPQPAWPAIDGLRALAVLGVVLYHAGWSLFGGGFVGVDVFFVISGFLLGDLLWRGRARLSFTDFMARRIRRLLPALLLMLATIAVLAAWWYAPGDRSGMLRAGQRAAYFTSNVYFEKHAGDYFAASVKLNPFLHTWSLAVEFQFYLLLFALAWLAFRFGRTAGNIVLGAATIASFCYAEFLLPAERSTAFYLLLPRFWELGIGACLALNRASLCGGIERYPRGRMASFWLGAGAVIAAMLLFDADMRFPGLAAALPVGGSLLMLAAIVAGQRSPLDRAPVVQLGRLSYGWYLWHWPLIAMLAVYGARPWTLWVNTAAIGVALLLAYASWRWVESPLRFIPALRRVSTWGSLAALALVAVLAGKLASHDWKGVQFSDEYDLARIPQCAGEAEEARSATLTPRQRCTIHADEGGSMEPAVYVWGDSHASHYGPLFAAFAADTQLPVLMRGSAGSPPLAGTAVREPEGTKPIVTALTRAKLAEISALPQLKGVVLSAYWTSYIGDPPAFAGSDTRYLVDAAWSEDEVEQRLSTDESLQIMARTLDATLATLVRQGKRVLVIADSPEFPWRVPDCLYYGGDALRCAISRHEAEAQRSKVLAVIRAASSRYPQSVRIWDPFKQVCDAERCSAVASGIPIYRDSDHFNPAFIATLYPVVRDELAWLVSMPPAKTLTQAQSAGKAPVFASGKEIP
ncbi:acyltransferase family protein [Chitinolyticbacter albus]|uniref:acyltransferase family protein n=1 Tax=Chitinolyticbacter albus TaxID=2961951 RepID=UPI00210B92D4|nr:acyltransferase family protein [Chitinolyticbacter albus]